MPLTRKLLGGVALGVLLLWSTGGAHAQTKIQQLEQQIQQIQQNYQNQIQNLQSQVDQLKEQQRQQAEQAEVVRNQAAQAAAEVKRAESGLPGTYHIGGVTLKVGGFIESASIYRTSNQTADVGSNYGSGIPFTANPNAHIGEFRESARQSRLSLLATGQPDPVTKLSAYFESDFLGAAPTANSNESNSYNLRLRQAFAEYDRTDWGFSLAGGQMWSLATLETSGLYPRNEAVPLTIDAQYNVGFNWMRVPQLRFIQNFAPGLWGAISFENPAALVYGGANGVSGVLTSNPGVGGGLLNNGGSTFCSYGSGTPPVACGEGYTGTSFTLDVMPDIIAKVAWEPGWGHFELYGLGREFRTQLTKPVGTTGAGSTPTAFGGGIGAGAVMPVIPKMLDVTANFLGGWGIGKYGSGQLPDFTINPNNGAPALIPEIEGMVGVIAHPTPVIDLYSYVGIEQAGSKAFTVAGKPFGYGNGGYTNGPSGPSGGGTAGAAGCLLGNEGGTTVINQGAFNTAGVGCNIDQLWQAQFGGWWNFYKGDYGRMALGASYSYVHVGTFAGTNGSPSTSDNIVMLSFRYYPF